MSVSIVFLRAVVSEVQSRGIDPTLLLQQSGLDASRLTDIRDSLDPDECERLIDAAVELTEDEAIGLSVGANGPPHTLHLFGQLLLAQPSIRESFAMAKRYSSLVASGPTWTLVEKGELATWGLRSLLPAGRLRRVLSDYAVTLTRQVGRFQVRPGERLHSVVFQHEAPPYVERYRDFFSCPVFFGKELSGVVFPRALLDQPQIHADETVAALTRESAEQLLREREQTMRVGSQVRSVLRYHSNLADVSLEKTAKACRLSVRVMRRRLLAEGLTFSALVDEARCRAACEALQRDNASIPETAESLGFSEPSAFFRAFKRWTGRTPSQFRRDPQAPAHKSSP